MITYIAFLRGINVGGHHKIKMADLREMLQKMNFEAIETYIQSGNIVFKTKNSNKATLEKEMKAEIAKTFGFDIPVLVRERTNLEKILKESPFTNATDIEANKIYYVLLKNEVQESFLDNLQQENYPNELFVITKKCIYLNCRNGAGKAKLTTTILEKKLKVEATTRNHRTLLKLIELSQ